MTVTQTVIAAIATLGAAALAGWWARKGQNEVSANSMAIELLKSLEKRVISLEVVRDWQLIVSTMDRDHIDALRQHIIDQLPPPPPIRPVYPPRPQS